MGDFSGRLASLMDRYTEIQEDLKRLQSFSDLAALRNARIIGYNYLLLLFLI